MAIALVTSTSVGGSSSGNTTSAIDTTGSNLLVLVLTYYGTSVPVISDNKSNVWIALTDKGSVSLRHTCIYYCASPVVGTGHTFTMAMVASYPTLHVAAFSGAHARPFDVENGTDGGAGTATSQVTGNVTPAQSNCLVIAGVANEGSAMSIDSSFSLLTSLNNSPGLNIGGALAYQIQTTPTYRNPAWAWTTASYNSAVIAVFRAAPAAGLTKNYYAISEGAATTQQTTMQDKLTLSFIPEANSTYLILASWQIGYSVAGGAAYADSQMQRTTGTAKIFNEFRIAPASLTNFCNKASMGVDYFGAVPSVQTYKIQFCTSNGANTTTIKNARIFAIKLSSTAENIEQAARTTTTSISYQDKAVLAFVPATAGDYIILAVADIDSGSTSRAVYADITVDGTAKTEVIRQPGATAYIFPFISMRYVTLTAALHTIKVQFRNSDAVTTMGIANARIIAIRADAFTNAYQSATDAFATTNNAAYQDGISLTQTPVAGDHLVLENNVQSGDALIQGGSQFLQGSTVIQESLWTPVAAADKTGVFSVTRQTLAASSTVWKTQYKGASGLNEGTGWRTIVVLQLANSNFRIKPVPSNFRVKPLPSSFRTKPVKI